MERIWERLKMPRDNQLSMVVDYSRPSFSFNLIPVSEFPKAEINSTELYQNKMLQIIIIEEQKYINKHEYCTMIKYISKW